MIKGMEISINRLVEVYFDRYPRSLPSESTWDVEKVRSFNSKELWDGEAEVLVNIDCNEPDGWGNGMNELPENYWARQARQSKLLEKLKKLVKEQKEKKDA